jgi:hypothetical protein
LTDQTSTDNVKQLDKRRIRKLNNPKPPHRKKRRRRL